MQLKHSHHHTQKYTTSSKHVTRVMTSWVQMGRASCQLTARAQHSQLDAHMYVAVPSPDTDAHAPSPPYGRSGRDSHHAACGCPHSLTTCGRSERVTDTTCQDAYQPYHGHVRGFTHTADTAPPRTHTSLPWLGPSHGCTRPFTTVRQIGAGLIPCCMWMHALVHHLWQIGVGD